MTLEEIFLGGGGLLAAALTLLQLAPVKLNPWSALAKALGRAFNGEVLNSVKELQAAQDAQSQALNKHIQADDERNADTLRMRILHFNNEILRGDRHTREDFIEILSVMDAYESYCRSHPNYKNNRAVHAIANIGRIYDERLRRRDFLGELPEKTER